VDEVIAPDAHSIPIAQGEHNRQLGPDKLQPRGENYRSSMSRVHGIRVEEKRRAP
jgi:hypothetical protein